MIFLDYLSAQGDANAAHLHECLSGLADGANDLAAVIAYLRSALGDSEAVLAVEEAVHQWRKWRRTVKESLTVELSRKSSPDLLTTCGNGSKLEGRQATTTNEG